MQCRVKLKRIYQEAEKSDGFKILIDRLWPRGLSKEKARVVKKLFEEFSTGKHTLKSLRRDE